MSGTSLTEIAFDDARKQARDLDQHFSKHGTLVGPLHGIPVTLKDQFNLKGLDTTLGYVARAFSPVGEDAVLVNMLKRLGAIVIAKSNLPQSIMVRLHSDSRLFEFDSECGLTWLVRSGARPKTPSGA